MLLCVDAEAGRPAAGQGEIRLCVDAEAGRPAAGQGEIRLTQRTGSAMEVAMPHATNRLDGSRTYFEDDGGQGAPVVLHGGFLDSVVDVRESSLARALPAGEFRMIYVDH